MAKATIKKAAATPKKAAAKKAVAPPPKKAASKKAAPPKKEAPKKAPPKKGNLPAKKVAPPKKGTLKKAVMPVPKAAAKKTASKSDETMMQELFLDSLKDIYWAEKSLTKALPKLAKAATSPELKQALEDHAMETEGQVSRLEKVFEALGKKAQGKKCEAMEGLTKEADSLVKETKKGSKTRDVALIMAAQKVEHYEIATYGSLATLAAQTGLSEVKELLAQTLEEEKNADNKLTQIAESNVNQQAQQEGTEDEEDEKEESEGKSTEGDKDEDLDPQGGDDSKTES